MNELCYVLVKHQQEYQKGIKKFSFIYHSPTLLSRFTTFLTYMHRGQQQVALFSFVGNSIICNIIIKFKNVFAISLMK